MIAYKCICGSTFIAGKLHKKTGKDGKTKVTYFGSEVERKTKREWKDKHGNRRGNYLTEVKLHNPGHGYTRNQMTKH